MLMPNYYVSKDGYPDLARALKEKGYEKVVLIGGKRALHAAAPKVEHALKGEGHRHYRRKNLRCRMYGGKYQATGYR